MTAVKAPANRKITLRDVQKAHTRQRLIEAACSVFFRDGYYGATVDQIVAEASASRPTFYLHFRDKAEILEELMALYWARATPCLERLPEPRPTLGELKSWLDDVGLFFQQERALASLVHEVSANKPAGNLNYGLETVDVWINALGRRAPAFAAAAAGKGQDIEARAMAEILVIEIVWAAGNVARNKGAAFTDATVAIVAKSLHDFLNDPRFHAHSPKRKAGKGA
jgi:AcrR family transcriptional regulator